MTAYVARRDCGSSETVVAPPYARSPAESLLGLEAGERIEVRDLLYGLLLVSGNDAADGTGPGRRRVRGRVRRRDERRPPRPRARGHLLQRTRSGSTSPATTRAPPTSSSWRSSCARTRSSGRIFDTASTTTAERRPAARARQPQRPRPDRALRQRGEDRLHDRRRQRARRLGDARRHRARLGGARARRPSPSAMRRACSCSSTASRSTTGGPRFAGAGRVTEVAIADRDVEVGLAPTDEVADHRAQGPADRDPGAGARRGRRSGRRGRAARRGDRPRRR